MMIIIFFSHLTHWFRHCVRTIAWKTTWWFISMIHLIIVIIMAITNSTATVMWVVLLMMIMMMWIISIIVMVMLIVAIWIVMTVRILVVRMRVFFFFWIGSAHMNTNSFYNMTFSTKTLCNISFNKCDKTKCTKWFRYVNVDYLTILGKVVLKIFRG